MAGKVLLATEAVPLVRDGSTLALGGFSITRNVIGLVHEIVRAGRRNLTLVQVIGGMDTDLLVGAGCVRRLVYSGGSLDRFGFLNAVNLAAEEGSLETVEYSSLALTLRLHAGAMGLPYVACRAMLGSDLLDRLVMTGDVALGEDPFGAGPVVLLPPLQPDVAIVHVDQADPDGNATIAGPEWSIRETAFASHVLLLLAEEVVPPRSIAPDRVVIPAAVVTGVVSMAHGAHPTAVAQRYDCDRAHLQEYVGFSRRGRDGMAEYLDRYVLGVSGHLEYLRLVSGAKT